jgi:hypothetical protein
MCQHRFVRTVSIGYFDADVPEAMENRMKSTPTDARPITAWAMSLSEKAG